MPTICIKNGNIILKDRILRNSSILIDNGKIRSIGKRAFSGSAETIEAKRCFVSPGFIDTHVHGEPEEVFSRGVKSGMTSAVIAISCASRKAVSDKLEQIRLFMEKDPLGANLLGARLEGPFINKEKAGAQDKKFILDPSGKTLRSIIKDGKGIIRIMTLAPEQKGAIKLIGVLGENKIIPSIGHSNATYEEARQGIEAGITHATHIFNAMSPFGKHDQGAAGASLLDNRVTAEVILDLKHVHRLVFELLVQVKSRYRIILITDSIAAEPGGARLAEGVYTLENGTTAGSALTMARAVGNAAQYCSVDLCDAVNFASINPARLLGIEKRTGSIEKGKDADIVIFNNDFDVKMTMVRGKIVYQKSQRG